MRHKSTQAEAQSSRTWERLKAFVREHVLRFIQAVLEADWSSPRHVGCCGIVVRLSSRGGKRSLLVGVGLSLVSVWWPLTLVPAQEGLSQKEQQQIEAQAALMAAEELYDHGQPDKAIEQWREALRLDPSLTKAHHDLGLALRDKSQLVEAVAELRAAVRLDPRDASAQADLGDALQERGDLAGARLASTLNIHPPTPISVKPWKVKATRRVLLPPTSTFSSWLRAPRTRLPCASA